MPYICHVNALLPDFGGILPPVRSLAWLIDWCRSGVHGRYVYPEYILAYRRVARVQPEPEPEVQ